MDNNEMIPVKENINDLISGLLEKQNYVKPYVNIYETDSDFVLVANMPGVSRSDLKVKVEKDSLIMFGKIDYDKQINNHYILNEQEIGNYYRMFNISDSVNQEKIEAKYDNGQLIVNLPKNEKIKPRKIDIL
jgi:HSP20 family protein